MEKARGRAAAGCEEPTRGWGVENEIGDWRETSRLPKAIEGWPPAAQHSSRGKVYRDSRSLRCDYARVMIGVFFQRICYRKGVSSFW